MCTVSISQHGRAANGLRNKTPGALPQVISAAVRTLRLDLEAAYICGDAPKWFSRLMSKCRVDAGTAANSAVHYHDEAFMSATGEAKRLAYHEAYLPAFAEAFPRSLAKALAKHDRQSGT